MDKTVPDLKSAIAGIEDGMVLMVGGFGGSGAPIELIHALIDRFKATGSPKNLTVVNNNAGNGRIGIAAMIDAGMVAKMICSFPRSADPRAFTEKYLAGEIGLELVPQGTLAERIRAGGAGAKSNGLLAGIDEVPILFARGRCFAEIEDAILGVEDRLLAGRLELGDHFGEADAQIDIGAVLDVLRGAPGDLGVGEFGGHA